MFQRQLDGCDYIDGILSGLFLHRDLDARHAVVAYANTLDFTAVVDSGDIAEQQV